MKRSPMKRGTPAFVPRDPDRVRSTPTPVPDRFRNSTAANDAHAPIAKECAIQHEGYMSLVRALPCAHCGFSAARCQFAHADEGKGAGIKTDCRRGMPLCGPHDHNPGCHWLLGTSGRIPKEHRRALEVMYGEQTRAAIVLAGTWPASLPKFPTA